MIKLNEEQEKDFQKLMESKWTQDKVKGNNNYGTPKVEYLKELLVMDIPALKKATKDKIWLSAYANNNARSDYHYQCDLCYIICELREKDLYDRLHKQVVEANT